MFFRMVDMHSRLLSSRELYAVVCGRLYYCKENNTSDHAFRLYRVLAIESNSTYTLMSFRSSSSVLCSSTVPLPVLAP
jgi:hypothetical protein